jgi:predicted Ser/Thr protein kinase
VASASLINQTIGNYRVTSQLGEGGMGVVYLAQHPVIGRKVAIKLLHAVLARDPDIVARFFNEARAIHMIAHENIVEILDFGQTADGQPYFIMEYLTGESLSELVSRGALDVTRVQAIGSQMCRALAAAHTKGIVHRDLKPHNVQMCTKADGSMLVKILDFGVAKILASPDGSQSVKTRTGSLMGTPLYMSPEQCKGAGALDHRTDIYSLGVMLFEMVAGRPPFVAEGVGELFAKHMLEDPPPVTEFAPATPSHVAAAIMKALAKDPQARFADMEEFRKALVGEIKLAVPGVPQGAGGRDQAGGAGLGGRHRYAPALQPVAVADPFAARVDHAVVGKLGAGRITRGAQGKEEARHRRRGRSRRPGGFPADSEVGASARDQGRPAAARCCRRAAPARASGEEDGHHPLRVGACGRPSVHEEGQQGPREGAGRSAAPQGQREGRRAGLRASAGRIP